MSKRLIVALTAALTVLTLVAQVMAAQDEPENPLEPLDASSPRASIESFIEQATVTEEAALRYRSDRSLAAQEAYFEEVERTRELFDLSEVPAASQGEVVEENFVSLADILLRVPLPEPGEMPDADTVASEELTQWTLPGTEITLRTLEEGDRAGNWVFTPRTVANLSGWRDEVEGLPVLVEGRDITDWRRNSDISTGPLVPAILIDALPDVANERVFGSPLWKSIAAVLGGLLIALLVILWQRFIGRRGEKGTARHHVYGATTPLVLFGLLLIYELYMGSQVNPSGELAEAVVVGTTIAFWLGVAWLFYELVNLVSEWAIATPRIPDKKYDPHLLRLITRVVSIVGVALIVLVGANQIGIPALGLLAGASVAGLVVGLAAQPTLENLIGGMTLFADKPFVVGDYVRFGEDDGTVEDIGPRSTRIRKLDGTQLTVPNKDIVDSRIANSTARDNALFLHTIGVRYETTLEQIEWLVDRIRSGLREHHKVEQDENLPRVLLAGFGASSIDIEARAYVDTTSVHEFMAVQAELLAMIMRAVEDAGTGMAFPSTTAYLTRDDGIEGPEALAAAEVSGPPAAAEATEPTDAGSTVAVDENLHTDLSQGEEEDH